MYQYHVTRWKWLGIKHLIEDRSKGQMYNMCAHLCVGPQAREEGKALLRQISQVRDQTETPSGELFVSLSDNNTPIKRVSPLNLSSFTP